MENKKIKANKEDILYNIKLLDDQSGKDIQKYVNYIDEIEVIKLKYVIILLNKF